MFRQTCIANLFYRVWKEVSSAGIEPQSPEAKSESFYIKTLILPKNYTEFNCIKIFFYFSFVRQLNALQRKKKKLETVVWGSGPVVWGSELLCGVQGCWCGVRRSVLQIMGFGGQKCGARPPSLYRCINLGREEEVDWHDSLFVTYLYSGGRRCFRSQSSVNIFTK